jgi:hypothetical protein
MGPNQKRLSLNGMSVLPSTADMRRLHRHVGFAPNPEVSEGAFWADFPKPTLGLPSSISDQASEALVHVILMMAVEERIPGIGGDEVDLRRGEPR